MKKYTKPMIVFESFTLSTSIAGDCEEKIKTFSEGQCAYKFVDEFGDTYNVFIVGIQACTTHGNDGSYDKFCYDVPLGGIQIFNS